MSTLFSRFFEKNNEIVPQEAEFTEVLGTIAVVPKMLYFYGKIPEKRLKTVAIVGTRRPTEYGRGVTYQLAYAAAQAGAVVVSGLAYGLDSVAHRAALDAGGVTLAVLGTPIDEIYPRVHERLAAEIVEKGGAVLSELAPGEVYHRQACFLQRNRIIAGLADVVVIAEAAARSGSLNTAAHALEQGREVMAVPGDIRRPLSEGCNRLIRQGAMPCLGTEDLLEMLFPERRKRSRRAVEVVGESEAETAVLRELVKGGRDGAELLERLGMEVAELNQTLTLLEIKGRVLALGANKWAFKQ